jgi:hypothetical protein
MKVCTLPYGLGVFLVVNIEKVHNRFLAFIEDRYASLLPKKHRPPGVEAFAVLGAHLQWRTPEVFTYTMPDAEEITDRTLYTWFITAFPVDTQDNTPSIVFLWYTQRHPDVFDATRAGDVCQCGLDSWLNHQVIKITSVFRVATDSLTDVLSQMT